MEADDGACRLDDFTHFFYLIRKCVEFVLCDHALRQFQLTDYHDTRSPINYYRLRTDLIALGLLATIVFLGISLFSYHPADPPAQNEYPQSEIIHNLCGSLGATAAYYSQALLGMGAYLSIILMLSFDIKLFSRENEESSIFRLMGLGAALIAFCVALQYYTPNIIGSPIVGSGGFIGAWGTILLSEHFTFIGITIIIVSLFAAGLLMAGESLFLSRAFGLAFAPVGLVGRLKNRGGSSTKTLPFKRKEKNDLEEEDENEEYEDEEELEEEEYEEEGNEEKNVYKLHVEEDGDDDDEGEELEYEEETEAEDEEEEDDGEEYEYEEDEYEDEEELEEEEKEEERLIPINAPSAYHVGEEEEFEGEEEEEAEEEEWFDEYELPDLEMFEDPEEFPFELLAKKAKTAAVILEKTFQDFNLNIRVASIDTGPVITQFELELEAGLRLSKVTALSDDLAIALRVPSVRVVPSIPGKNTVGIEVPNEKRVMVRIKELIQNSSKEIEKMKVPIFLGKDVSGHPLTVDLTKMPHILIAGRTGTGKSVCLNTLILSILATRTPDEVKMLMIDPKMVELSPYKELPHLMHPVITDMKKAEAVLGWAVDKMEERYDLLARAGVRHLEGFNKLGRDKVLKKCGIALDSEEADAIPEKMPYIIIVADEMADMMMTSGKDVEGHIIRLAQKSRAVGIHLVLATQKPTVDVITGLIKSNLPARLSFQVASRTDSRVVLDEMGAEKLLGNGDMLYLAPGTSKVTRAQGTFVSDEEINSVIEFFSEYETDYCEELKKVHSSAKAGNSTPDEMRKKDDLYEDAVDVIVREGRGSVSLLQRALGVGYGRGARLIDYMAEDGIVGEYNGSQAREVLYSAEDWEAAKAK